MLSADLIITNAKVLTINAERPRADAVAIAGNRIIRVGTRGDMAVLHAPHTRVVDAQMKTVMPGIIEGHVHLFGGGVELGTLNLNGINGFESIAAAISQYRKSHPGQAVVVATGIAHTAFGADVPVTRHVLDRIVSDVPFIVRYLYNNPR